MNSRLWNARHTRYLRDIGVTSRPIRRGFDSTGTFQSSNCPEGRTKPRSHPSNKRPKMMGGRVTKKLVTRRPVATKGRQLRLKAPVIKRTRRVRRPIVRKEQKAVNPRAAIRHNRGPIASLSALVSPLRRVAFNPTKLTTRATRFVVPTRMTLPTAKVVTPTQTTVKTEVKPYSGGKKPHTKPKPEEYVKLDSRNRVYSTYAYIDGQRRTEIHVKGAKTPKKELLVNALLKMGWTQNGGIFTAVGVNYVNIDKRDGEIPPYVKPIDKRDGEIPPYVIDKNKSTIKNIVQKYYPDKVRVIATIKSALKGLYSAPFVKVTLVSEWGKMAAKPKPDHQMIVPDFKPKPKPKWWEMAKYKSLLEDWKKAKGSRRAMIPLTPNKALAQIKEWRKWDSVSNDKKYLVVKDWKIFYTHTIMPSGRKATKVQTTDKDLMSAFSRMGWKFRNNIFYAIAVPVGPVPSDEPVIPDPEREPYVKPEPDYDPDIDYEPIPDGIDSRTRALEFFRRGFGNKLWKHDTRPFYWEDELDELERGIEWPFDDKGESEREELERELEWWH